MFSNTPNNDGFSLLETLVTLAILMVILSTVVAGYRPPSDQLKIQRAFSEIVLSMTNTRSFSINSGQTSYLKIEVSDAIASNCAGGTAPTINVFSDGTVSEARFCIEVGKAFLEVKTFPLTGELMYDVSN